MKPILSVFALFFSQFVFAQTITLGQPILGGSGCPIGSVSAVLAPDGSAISILFSQFSVVVPANTTQSKVAECSFNIPISVTRGFIVEGNYVDYRGFANIPAGGLGRLSTSSPVWRRFNRFMEVYNANPAQPQREIYARHFAVQQQWGTPRFCPQPPIQFATKLEVSGKNSPEDVMLTLDSADIANVIDGPIVVGITIRKCG